ncbi:putative ankyrin repeat protein RBE_0220 [Gigantopelta aegis]|uniref:putative ankyrin repeat protein RBE_0220 n=1 Tax=Gigantopelta aegis TaxID=1735272 RepID=UPI001B88A583|nr:putative ankyrin repeat protein RBE_0220 [Gigantopelta aegis]
MSGKSVISDEFLLFDSITKGKVKVTKFILQAAKSNLLNIMDAEGRTPLILCCQIKEEVVRGQMLKTLLTWGADVNLPDSMGRTVLSFTCQSRLNDVVRILIHHPDINPDAIDNSGNTALIYCGMEGNDVAMEMLLKNFRRLGLKVDHCNNRGDTALLAAAKAGNIQCARLLVEQGKAMQSKKDRTHGKTAFQWLKEYGYERDELDFLRRDRFYRVAKLATSLARSSTVSQPRVQTTSRVTQTEERGTTAGSTQTNRSHVARRARLKNQTSNSSVEGTASVKNSFDSMSSDCEMDFLSHPEKRDCTHFSIGVNCSLASLVLSDAPPKDQEGVHPAKTSKKKTVINKKVGRSSSQRKPKVKQVSLKERKRLNKSSPALCETHQVDESESSYSHISVGSLDSGINTLTDVTYLSEDGEKVASLSVAVKN